MCDSHFDYVPNFMVFHVEDWAFMRFSHDLNGLVQWFEYECDLVINNGSMDPISRRGKHPAARQ